MGTTLATLAPPRGAKHKKKRLGRGPGSGKGTTAGKGQKGQTSRSGGYQKVGFEGGQMPLQRRLPKRGFKNIFRIDYAPVNLDQLAEIFEANEVINPALLKERGLVPVKAKLTKVLGRGELSKALSIKAHAFSSSAIEKIKAAGGECHVLENLQGARSKKTSTVA